MASILTDLADGVRRLQKIKTDMSELELREEILALRELLATIRESLLEKDEQIRSLEERMKKQSTTVEITGFRYDVVDEKPVGLPYCPTCEVREGKLYRLSYRTKTSSWCSNCKVLHHAASSGIVHGRDAPDNIVPRDNSWIV